MDHGEPGVNEFANSVYKVASNDEEASNSSNDGHYAGTNPSFDDLVSLSDSFSDESDSYDNSTQNYSLPPTHIYPSEQNR